MDRFIRANLTDQTVDVFLGDSSVTSGAGKTGLAYDTGSLTCYYRRGAVGSSTVLNLATQTVGGAHSDGGFVEIDATNMPGMYRLDLSDAILASGVKYVTVFLQGAANMQDTEIQIQIDDLSECIDRNAALVESNRGAHTYQGNFFYVDPVNGDTHANGNRGGKSDPYLTIQDCHDNAVTDSNHDVIFLVAGHGSTATTHSTTGTTTISKRYVFIRGPGRDFICTRGDNGDTFTVTADGVELSGFQLETKSTGSGNGVQLTDADFLRVQNVWVNATQGDGINILRGENCQIVNNVFTDTGQGGSGDGIDIKGTAGSSNNNMIRGNHFHDCAGNAIVIADGTTNDTTIQHNTIHGSTSWGINIGASSTNAIVSNNTLGNNTSGDITDAGTTSVIKNNVEWAKHSIATEARLVELDAANLPADLDLVLADTNELQTDWVDGGRLDLIVDATLLDTGTSIPALLPSALVGGRMDSSIGSIVTSTAAASALAQSAAQIVEATVDTVTNTHTPTTTVFQADDITEATADHYNGRIIIFTSGILSGQATSISDYVAVGGIGQFTVVAMTEAPANNDTFIIL